MTSKLFGVSGSRIIVQLSVYNGVYIGPVKLAKLNTNSYWRINFNVKESERNQQV